jgi:hypothetical protein
MNRVTTAKFIILLLISFFSGITTTQENAIAGGYLETKPVYADYPHIKLSNGVLDVTVVLPDENKGFYRGTRFDWSGMVAEINFKNHSFVEQWYFPHTPTQNNNGIGTSEEFRIPLGYSEVQTGEDFIKIGIGLLKKASTEKYNNNLRYDIKDNGQWIITKGSDWIEFNHRISSTHGHAYDYIKRIELAEDAAVLVIKRCLKNSGTKPIISNHYGHNFFQLDKQRIDNQYRMRFPFKVSCDKDFDGRAKVEDQQILMTKKLNRKEAFGSFIRGYDNTAETNQVIIENIDSETGIKIAGDKSLALLYWYVVDTAICPEPFVNISIESGQEFCWETSYTFYEF